MNIENENNDPLWKVAKARVTFRHNLFRYIVVNLFLIAVWFFTSRDIDHFWPIWPMLGWGIAIAIQYFNAYHTEGRMTVEDEYEKLKKERNG